MKMKTLSLAIAASCLIYSAVDAAGLGKLSVLSALGQPLRAEIELTSVTKEDVGNLFPKLADNEAYRQANVDFNPVLLSLKFEVEDRGSRYFVLVTSAQPVSDPYLELLVELTSSSGRLVREYPVVLNLNEAPSNNAVIADQNRAPSAIASQDQISQAKKTRAAKLASTKQADLKPYQYEIKPGDTLEKIARQVNYDGVSLDQMLVALQRENPSAFIHKNMNLIRSGAILIIPDKNAVEQTSESDAKKVVLAQAIDFNAYRDKLALSIAYSDPERTARLKKTNSGKITAKVIEKPTLVNEAPDKLQLSKGQLQEKEIKALEKQGQEELKQLEVDKIAEQQALESTNERIKELEKNTEKLQKLLTLQGESLVTSSHSEPENPEVSAEASTSLPVIEANIPKPPVEEQPKPAELSTAPEQPKPVAAQEKAPESSQQSLMDYWTRYSHYAPYGGALLALLAGVAIFLGYKAKKRKSNADQSGAETSFLGSDTSFADTDSAESDNNAVSNEPVAPTSEQLREKLKERVRVRDEDPLTEADSYLAYGRDDQAEEILKEALNNHPDRHSLRLKLLEIYARRKDVLNFGLAAGALYEMTGGQGSDWERAASMGRTIDPANLLYADEQSAQNIEVVSDANLQNDEALETTGHEDCPECEKTGMHMHPANLDTNVSASPQEELVQVETTRRTSDDISTLDMSTPISSAPMEFDLSGIDLELPKHDLEAAAITASNEIGSKLELAIAYQKIGDKEGARELLGEVIRGGDREQAARAQSMLSELT